MIIEVKHTTTYNYSELLNRSQQILRLIPMTNSHQKVLNWKLSAPTLVHRYQDWYGNQCGFLEINKSDKLSHITIEAIGRVETNHSLMNEDVGCLPLDYLMVQTNFTQMSRQLIDFAADLYKQHYHLITSHNEYEFFALLSQTILKLVPYVKGVTQVDSTAADSFRLQSGVCQDHAHLLLALTRYFNIPARYVSGYIYTEDTSHVESHAWAEVWYNNAWHSFDVSNQCQAGINHIGLACGSDYSSASPIRGSRVGGGLETLETFASVVIE